MERQPTYNAMQRARKMVRDLEALNMFKLGPQSWQIIERTFAEQEAAQERAYEADLTAARAEVERLKAERDALREALASVATGLRTFVPSHENSEAFARECDAALESEGQS